MALDFERLEIRWLPTTVAFSSGTYAIAEDGTSATIDVTLSATPTQAMSVQYSTSNGTATADSDYTAVSGTLSFASGETSKTFTIPIINDTVVESDETVNLTLSNPTGGATLGNPSAATLTISSDDSNGQPTTVTFQQGSNGYSGTTDASISTQYAIYTGGNGVTNFALPDLRGRTAIHVGNGHVLGERAGEDAHTLVASEMPAHAHVVQATGNDGTTVVPTGNVLARVPARIYESPANLTALRPETLTVVGGSQPHTNMQPYLVLNFVIALQGIFPSRN